jgi:hypothetical protein
VAVRSASHRGGASASGAPAVVIERAEVTWAWLRYYEMLVVLDIISNYVYNAIETKTWKNIRLVVFAFTFYVMAISASQAQGTRWIMLDIYGNICINVFFFVDGIMKLISFSEHLRIDRKFGIKNTFYLGLRRCGLVDIVISILCFVFTTTNKSDFVRDDARYYDTSEGLYILRWLQLLRVFSISLFGVQQLRSLDVLMVRPIHMLSMIVSVLLIDV